MDEPIKMPEPCCAACQYGRYDEESEMLMCSNSLQVWTWVDDKDYCFYFEYPF